MSDLVALRRMSKRGIRVCLAGWALLILASALPGYAWLVVMACGSIGAIVLSPHVGLEIHTLRGMIRWCGLFIVWPWTLFVSEGIFIGPEQWANPPRSTV